MNTNKQIVYVVCQGVSAFQICERESEAVAIASNLPELLIDDIQHRAYVVEIMRPAVCNSDLSAAI